MKKTTIIVIILSIIISGVAFGAINEVIENVKKAEFEKETFVDYEKLELSANKALTEENLLSFVSKDEVDEKTAKMYLDRYIDMIYMYELSETEINYINNLIKNGYDLEKTITIYYFLVNCEEDYTYIDKIYDNGKDIGFEDNYWLYSAYNSVTNEKHGLIEANELGMFISSGVSQDDVMIAVEISRNSDEPLIEILNQRKEKEQWADIIKASHKKAAAIDTKKIKNQDDGRLILEGIRYSRITKMSVNDTIKDIENGFENLNTDKKIREKQENANLIKDKYNSTERSVN